MTFSARDQAIISTAAPPPAGAYSHGIVAGDLLFTSGFGGHDPRSGQLGPTIEEQTRQTLLNLEAVLGERSLTLNDVIKVNVYLQHPHRDFAAFNGVYKSVFDEPYPARTTVGSDLLGLLIEIDVIARLPG
jgi:2-iminobutanoate/2-iminopropanoate deaminase